MCEVEETYSEELQGPERERKLGQTCMKCKEASAVLIIRVGDAFCKSCFKEYFVHKFRAMLGKNRVVFPGEKVLLGFSGGPSSSAMIQQVQEGLSRKAPKKLRFLPGIVFIDEGAMCGQSWEERQKTISEVQRVLQGTSFPFHIVPLEQVFSLPSSVLQRNLPQGTVPEDNYKQAVGNFLGQQQISQSETLEKLSQLSTADSAGSGETLPDTSKSFCPPAELTQQLVQLFSAARTMTAKQELLHTLRTHLLLYTARCHGYSKVMSGDSCTRLSVRLLANISLGRGAFLPMDTGFSDSRFGDIIFIRPMREYSLKEISFYNRLFQVPSVFIPTLDTKAHEHSSIHRLSETFITKLQADFSSTVSTVYRTSEKLNTSSTDTSPENGPQERCLLCVCVLDTHVGRASAFHATQVSQLLSQKRPVNNSNPAKDSGKSCCKGGQCCDQAENKSGCLTGVAGRDGFGQTLCYSCRLTVKDMHSVDPLPQYILQEAEHRNRRSEMRKEIQEFLLEDE